MKRMLRVLTASVLAAGMVLTGAALSASAEPAEPAAPSTSLNVHHYGLHVENDGTITLEGEPFYAFGLNYFGAFCHNEGTGDPTPYREAFAGIAAHEIPMVRFPLSGYYPDYYERFDADPEAMLAEMKDILDAAAENHIGVLVSLMWWDPALPEHVGEKRAFIGQPESRTMTYAKNYVTTIVKAFADHPAVWGWEIGNEYNLGADLCDPNFNGYLFPENLPGFSSNERNGFDYYTSAELQVFYKEIAEVIRTYDDYRLITTGNGEMRGSAWCLHNSAARPNKNHLWNPNWGTDSKKSFQRAMSYYTPDPIDTMCFHLQSGTLNAENPSYVFQHDRYGRTLSSLEYFKEYVEAAKRDNKALIFGEFGDMLDMEKAPDCPEKFRELCGWIHESGIQLALLWQFQDYDDSGMAAEKLDVLADMNRELKEQGLLKTDAAWAPHETETTAPETTVPAGTTGTPADTTAPAADPAPAPETTTAPSKGCGSVIAPAAAASAVTLALGAAVLHKKKKQRPD